MMIALTDDPIDPRALEAAVSHDGAGAVLTFLGVTRNNFDGRPVEGLHYEAYPEMALAQLQQIHDEVLARWPGAKVAIVHRLGSLTVGEVSVVIATSTPHRDAAYQASRYAIDELKVRVPIWKREHYADGAADWKANKT
jgi:molybdopterin synthase catalytic subunit